MNRATGHSVPWWVPLFGVPLGLRPCLLTGDAIQAGLSLLYEVYVVEQGWEPPAGNPSGLVVDHEARQLTDDLVDDAVWVGVYRGQQLVGVTRLLVASRFGGLEMERYVDLPAELSSVQGELVEPNRLAIRKGFRNSWVLLLLQLATEDIARQFGAERSLAAMTPKQAERVERYLGWRRSGFSFRYHPEDPSPVEVICMNREDLAPLRTLRVMTRRQVGRSLGRVRQRKTPSLRWPQKLRKGRPRS